MSRLDIKEWESWLQSSLFTHWKKFLMGASGKEMKYVWQSANPYTLHNWLNDLNNQISGMYKNIDDRDKKISVKIGDKVVVWDKITDPTSTDIEKLSKFNVFFIEAFASVKGSDDITHARIERYNPKFLSIVKPLTNLLYVKDDGIYTYAGRKINTDSKKLNEANKVINDSDNLLKMLHDLSKSFEHFSNEQILILVRLTKKYINDPLNARVNKLKVDSVKYNKNKKTKIGYRSDDPDGEY